MLRILGAGTVGEFRKLYKMYHICHICMNFCVCRMQSTSSSPSRSLPAARESAALGGNPFEDGEPGSASEATAREDAIYMMLLLFSGVCLLWVRNSPEHRAFPPHAFEAFLNIAGMGGAGQIVKMGIADVQVQWRDTQDNV